MKMIRVLTLSPVALALTSFSSFAMELYDDGNTRLEVNGYLAADYLDGDGISEVADSSSRIGFHFFRPLDDGWTAKAGFEWGTDIINGGDSLVVSGDTLKSNGDGDDDAVWLRLGYIGLSHDKWGAFTVGKQWSTYYDVTVWTDMMETFGGEASGTYNFGTDGGVSGTGRAEQAMQWRKNYGRLAIGLQYEVTDETIEVTDNSLGLSGEIEHDKSYGASLVYRFDMGLALGASYNQAEFASTLATGDDISLDDKAWALGASFGQVATQGLYAAVVYSQSENHEIDNLGHLFDAKGLELYAEYGFENKVSVYAAYNHLESDDDDYDAVAGQQYELEYSVLGLAYNWRKDFKLYTEYKLEDSQLAFESGNGGQDQPDNMLSVGVKLAF